MALSVYQSSVGVFEVGLSAFSAILDKAAEHATAKKFDPAVYLAMRLSPNMLTFAHQVQNFTDHAKRASARLADVEAPRYEDNEKTIEDLKARIQKTIDFIKSLDPKKVEEGADREIIIPMGPNKFKASGANYFLHFALPNYYFHLTTAYDILRHAGVEIGKRDFMGAVPGVSRLDGRRTMSIERIGVGPRMSQAVVHGHTIYLSGQVAGEAAGKSVAEQTTEILATIDGILEKAGSDKKHILSATIYLADIATFGEMNAVWDKWVAESHTPARATVEAKLAAPRFTVEIACIAAKPK